MACRADCTAFGTVGKDCRRARACRCHTCRCDRCSWHGRGV
ncbi:UNVERIFIED_CONTAM: hypothetical protein GTU68_013757 [Idotea baltica]|nr:hypothetical protein [Idotea baltica]